jgi:hypothetical protein
VRSRNETIDTDFHMQGSRSYRRRWCLAIWFASISGSNLIWLVGGAVPWGNRPNSAFASDAKEPSSDSFNLDEYLALIANLNPHSILNPSASDLDSLAEPPLGRIAQRFNGNRTIVPSFQLLIPKVLPKARVQPTTTNWIFNGIPVNHLTSREFSIGSESGSSRNPLQTLNSIINLGGQTTEIVDAQRIYNLDYRGIFGQIQTLRQSRQVMTAVIQPSTIFGFRERLTLTADCTLPGTPTGSQCSYLPGLVTDRSSINNNQQATRIDQPSQFGEVVTPAALAAIKQPGFASGANGQNLGIDLYFPNAGNQPGNGQSNSTSIDRREEFRQTSAISSGRIHQVIRIGDREAAIGRTIRGNAYIEGNGNLEILTGLQLATESLPEAIPALPPATGQVLTINRNLFKTADLARLPENSFTLYNYGIGRAPHAAPKVAKITDIPAATYQAWWIGLSPVIDRSQTSQTTVQFTGPQQVIRDLGEEGGGDAPNVNIRSAVNGVTFDARQLQNVYQQAYVTAYQQDGTIFTQNQLTETTRYYPHFSYTGNITNSDAVFRYYAGAIVLNNGLQIDRVKTYAGLDYTQITARGLTYSIGGMIYTNPDPEYHSYAIGNVSQKIALSSKNSLNLAANINYIADGQITVDKTLFKSANSSINIGANLNVDRVSFGVTQSLASKLPNSIGNTLGVNLSIGLNDRLSIAGYWTPWNENAIRSPYGISANLRLGKDASSPSLSLGWNQNLTDFGRDAGGRNIQQQDNIFTVLFRVK